MAKQASDRSDGTVEAAQDDLAAGLGLDGEKQIILFAKRLAANDKAARDQALKRLQAWLAKHKGLSEVDLLKVWKGLFYCMWMSDKAPVQHQLAGNISRIVHCLGDDLPRVKLFVTTFYRTIRREWAGLDQHRLDKFYSFMRLMLRECLKFAKERRWSDDVLASAVFPLDTEILLQAPSSMPNGPRLHLCDLILPEVAQVAGADITTDDFFKLLHPFLHTMSKGGDKLLAARARERVLLDFVSEWSKRAAAATDGGEGPDEPYFPQVAVEEVQAVVFDLASSPDTREGLRADIYAAHHRFQRLTGKKMAGSKRRADDLVDDVGGGGSKGQQAKAREGQRPKKQVKLGMQEKQTASALEIAAQETVLQGSGEHPKKEKTPQTEEGKGSGKGQKRKRKLSDGQVKGGHGASKEATPVMDGVKVQEGKVKQATGDVKNKKQKPKGQANRDEETPAQGPNAVEQGSASSDAVTEARGKNKKQKQKAKTQALEVGPDAPNTSGGGEAAAAAVPVGDKPAKSKRDKKTSGVTSAESATNGKAPAAAQQAATDAAAGAAAAKRAKGKGGGGEKNTGGIKPVEAASDTNAAASDAKKPPQFIASSKFVGAKPLYAFKKGSKGVGYYLDAVQMGKGPALKKKVRFGKVHVRVFQSGEGQKKHKGKRRDPPGTVSFMGKKGGKGMRPKASAYF